MAENPSCAVVFGSAVAMWTIHDSDDWMRLLQFDCNGRPPTGGFTLCDSNDDDLAPSIASVTPNTGPVAGGTLVAITGANFVTGAAVSFGDYAGINAVVVNSTTINVLAPANPDGAGAVDVQVTNPDGGKGTLGSGFTYQ